ncbi:FtsK/SpoIIIE family protein [Microbacterium esteraromaticum]|uniref:FtsK/SpoIIIE family protein n=1 Tax=Microbacterium esteraromaticum TaxID=57043 RepID=A0A1R4JIV8_9MICO|nr:FtsK/SpoIIIE domain-containing protein [Microbacterium esteraromaticum]SJN31948.1 FtsK/SpoIIIE family protein [Microbacterium esteraromaticum]
MDATTIVLPAAPAEARRPQLPLLAAIVPVIAGVVLWLVTGSLFALCFAALGPLMLVSSYLDGLRSRRKERRRADAEDTQAWQRADAELDRLHAQEHAGAWARDPDVAECVIEPPLRGHEGVGRATTIVLGRGLRPSVVRASGGDDDRARAFAERAQQLDDAPIVVPLGGGVCIRAPEPVAAAVARALVIQLCLRFPPAQLGVFGDRTAAWSLDVLPHAGRRRASFRLSAGTGAERSDAVICVRAPGEEPPPGITTVLDFTTPVRARVRTPEGTSELSLEAVSAQQARAIASTAAEKADTDTEVPDRLAMDELPPARTHGLSATFGRGEHGDLTLDLVEDGPHAIVTGMTGTGKSELLTSWLTGMAAVHSPAEVAFVLVDFKGGTAFDPLRRLPHVVAVVTDLDAEGARRGVGSLTAELRRREAVMADAGARDVRDCPALARLVIVVDEFAALLQEHPDLAAIFTDVAARGRALGMHLVLGTQRASGIIRDALASNCPLRLSLRVAETADSRFVIGSDSAAELPGGADSRGLAFVRRPRDTEAHVTRIALTSDADLAAASQRWSGHERQRSPWLPPLPPRVALPDHGAVDAEAVFGLADEPEQQRQPWVTLKRGQGLAILGGPAAGKSSAVQMLASQLPDGVIVPPDLEGAWDAVAELSTGRHGTVLCDDLDLLVGQYPPDYQQLFLSRWEKIVRAPAGAVITLSRASGPLGRLIDALPQRALLRLTSKVEHIAAGGDPSAFDRARPAGRAWMDGREVQVCWTDEPASDTAQPSARDPQIWQPRRRWTGIVTAAEEATRTVLTAAHPGHRVISLGEADRAAADAQPEAQFIVVGDPEQWRAQWSLLQLVRSSGELLIAAECPTELRQLAGAREVPPFALAHADRAWSVEAGALPRRVLLN